MKGTASQAKWANDLRAQTISKAKRNGYSDEQEKAVLAKINELNESSWWIDHRAEVPNGLILDAIEFQIRGFHKLTSKATHSFF